MARYAVIDGMTVENIIEANEGFGIEGKTLVPATEDAYIGGTYENGAFVPRAVIITGDMVNREHDKRILAGKTFTITGYGDVPLEGSLESRNVLLALKDSARDLKAAGVTTAVLEFTDASSADHVFTADQLIELVDKGKKWMNAMHKAKRTLKAMDPDPGIPSDYAADKHWPI